MDRSLGLLRTARLLQQAGRSRFRLFTAPSILGTQTTRGGDSLSRSKDGLTIAISATIHETLRTSTRQERVADGSAASRGLSLGALPRPCKTRVYQGGVVARKERGGHTLKGVVRLSALALIMRSLRSPAFNYQGSV